MSINFKYRLVRKIVYNFLLKKGFTPYMGSVFADLLSVDFLKSNLPISKKVWAYKRGFLSQRIIHYKLTEDNYTHYLSDFDYYKMHPLNGRDRRLIDDKMTTKYVLFPFDNFLPEYYYILTSGNVVGLHNIDKKFNLSVNDVLETLKSKKVLALKKEASSGGVGFLKAIYDEGVITVNEKNQTESEFLSFLASLDDYIVMEYITAHDDIRKYYSGSTGVLRIMVINEKTPKIVNAYIRVGSKASGSIDAYTGSISAVVDINSGEYHDAWLHSNIDFIKIDKHPDSGIPFEGVIPHFEYVKNKILEISAYLPSVTYLGFDVCVTNDGFKIYEINSHQGIELYQLSYPLLKDNPAAEFFKKHIEKG